MMRKQKLFPSQLGTSIKYLPLQKGGRDSSKRYDCIYGNLSLIIGGEWVSCQNVRMETYDTQMNRGSQVKTYLHFFFFFCVKRVVQLLLQDLNFISQFNFNLALPDIIANKTLGESTLPGRFFFQPYVSKPFASTPCLGDLVFLFFNCFFFRLFFVYVITRDK